jgi:hypothetical protein
MIMSVISIQARHPSQCELEILGQVPMDTSCIQSDIDLVVIRIADR